jgi:hypothetical protein
MIDAQKGGTMVTRLQVGLLVLGLVVAGSGWSFLELAPRTSAAGANGDVNCSGETSATDAYLILQRHADLITDLPCMQEGDVSGDGRTDSIDAALILQSAAGLIPPYLERTPTITPTFTPTRLPCTAQGCPTATSTPTPMPCLPEGCGATPTPDLRVRLGPEFSMAIDVNGDGNDDCSTVDENNVFCPVEVGSTFELRLSLDALPDDFPGYDGIELVVTTGLFTLKGVPSAQPWPDCVFEAYQATEYGFAFGCVVGVADEGQPGLMPPSSYTGLVGTATFTCDSSGDISLVHGQGLTGLANLDLEFFAEANPGADSIRVDCLDLAQP